MDFNIDFGSLPLTPPAANAPLYASVPGRASALGNGEVVFYDETLDRTHVMTLQVLQAMDLCREFRTLDEHVASIVQAQPALARQQTAVKRVLEGLRSQGLLASDVTVLDRFHVDTAARNAPFGAVCIRACNRPEQLQRLLASLLAIETRFKARRRYVVIDDSTQADATARHAALLAEFSAATGAAVSHVTRETWQGVIDDLARALPRHDTALRGLLSRNPGAAGGIGMNLALLLTAGTRFALLDDDFVLPLHRHPAYRAGLGFGRGGGRAAKAFATPEAAMAAGVQDEADPFARHLAICGETLASVSAHADGCSLGVAELRGLDFSRTPTLRADVRVLATVNGHRGHSGAASPAWAFALDPAARAEMPRDRAAYDAWLDAPAVWSGASRHTVASRGNYTPFLIDNSRLMPPTTPDGRGEDALFASLAHLVYPRDVVLDLPYAVGHLQEGQRSRRALLSQAEQPTLALCFADLLDPLADVLVATDPVARLHGAAARLRDLGAGDTRALQVYLREFLGHRRSQRIETLQRAFANAGDAPAPFLDDLRAQIEANGKALTRGGVARLAGVGEDADAAQASAHLRDAANRMADGLDAWPEAWAVACERGDGWIERARIG